MSAHEALTAIDAASDDGAISLPAYRTAQRLLRLASPRAGNVRIAPDDLRRLVGTASQPAPVGTMRRQLTDLSNAGILHYSINGDVWISFMAWPAVRTAGMFPRTECAPTRTECADDEFIGPESEPADNDDSARARAPSARGDAHGARQRAESANPVIRGGLVGCLDDPPIPDLEIEPNKQTNNQDAPARDLSRRLLVRVGIAPEQADDLAAIHAFEFVRRAVAQWYVGRRSQGGNYQENPGIVVHWLRNPEKAGVGPLPDRFRDSDLWLEFRLPEEIEPNSQEVDFYSPEPAPDGSPQLSPAGNPLGAEPPQADARDDPTAAWQVLLRDLRHSGLSDPYTTPLYAARLEPIGDAEGLPGYRIVLAADADLALMQNRMISWVRRELGSIFGKRCFVEFVLGEPEP